MNAKRAIRRACIASALSLAASGVAFAQPAPATRATTAPAQPAGQLVKIAVVEVNGMVRVRQSEDQPYQAAKVGMMLDEGAEFQTGPRGLVRLALPPDQVVTIDRLTTTRVLRARTDGATKVSTDLGMKYGRTQYDVGEAGVEHDAAIRSPAATLAVRGTKRMTLYEAPLFPPVASASQRVEFRNLRRQVVQFGQAGRSATVTGEQNSPAENELVESNINPTGRFAGETRSERFFRNYLGNFPGVRLEDLTVLFKALQTDSPVVVSLPVDRALIFTMRWTGRAFSDVDLSVTAPNGRVVSIDNPGSPTNPAQGLFFGGNSQGGDGVADKNGTGFEIVAFPNSFPAGTYTVRAELDSKGGKGKGKSPQTQVQFVIVQQPVQTTNDEPIIVILDDQVNSRTKPVATRSVNAGPGTLTETSRPAASKRGTAAKPVKSSSRRSRR